MIPEGSMMEYLSVGSKEAPKPLVLAKKSGLKYLTPYFSPLCNAIIVLCVLYVQ